MASEGALAKLVSDVPYEIAFPITYKSVVDIVSKSDYIIDRNSNMNTILFCGYYAPSL